MVGLFIGRHRPPEAIAPSVKSEVVYSQATAPSKKRKAERSPSQRPATETAPSLLTADVISALRNTLQEPSGRRKSATLSRLMDAVDLTNVREVFDFTQNLPNEQDRSALASNVLERWAELNPTEAFAFAQSRPAGYDPNCTMEEMERSHIERAYSDEGGNVEKTAKRLGIAKSTLYQKLKALNLS